MLDSGGLRRGSSPFRLENMWLKEEGFKDLLKTWWEGFSIRGSFSFILTEKLKALKSKKVEQRGLCQCYCSQEIRLESSGFLGC